MTVYCTSVYLVYITGNRQQYYGRVTAGDALAKYEARVIIMAVLWQAVRGAFVYIFVAK